MSDSFTKVTKESGGSRIGKSFGGMLFGIILFIAAFPVLFINEGSEVKRIKGLKEGASIVQSISTESIDSSKEGALIHISGNAKTTDILSDNTFGLSLVGSKLERIVETYQWIEHKNSETKEKLGGGSETTTTYNYTKEWQSGFVNSSNFEKPEGHQNVESLYKNETYYANNVTVGAFNLNPSQISRVGNSESVTHDLLKDIPSVINGYTQLIDNTLYNGYNIQNPQIGDTKVFFKITKPGNVTIIAKQIGSSFAPFSTKNTTIDLLDNSIKTATEMFAKAKQDRKTLSWIIRAIGLFIMFTGLNMILTPISRIMGIIPLLGNITGGILSVIAFVICLGLSFITISIAWITFRPIIGIPLLLIGIAALIVPIFLKNRKIA